MIELYLRRYDEEGFYVLKAESRLVIKQFLEEFAGRAGWQETKYLYCLETGKSADSEKSFAENNLIPGDHLIAY